MTRLRPRALPHLALFVALAPPASAQTVTEWSAENRVALSVHVNAVALQRRLRPGWTSAPSTAPGERIDLQLAYRRAPGVKSHAETKLRSARHPELTRTYEIDQAADVVRSGSTPDRVESLTFNASGTAFAPLFDGQETLLSVTSYPWYVREISVP